MRLQNSSQYDTVALRRIFAATWRGVYAVKGLKGTATQTWKLLAIQVRKGQRNVRYTWSPQDQHTLGFALPRLTGTEFIPLMRQQHGGDQSKSAQHGGLEAERIALAMQQAIYDMWSWKRQRGAKLVLLISVRAGLLRANIPVYVPIRVLKQRVEIPQDKLKEKYDQLGALEKKWTTKSKLAQTKLKKIRERRKRYAKQLAARKQGAREDAA